MKSTEYLHCRTRGLARLMVLPIAALGLALGMSSALAVDAYYINNAIVTYPGTADYPPTIDASNFVNTSYFTVNFTENDYSLMQPFFETYDTVNYTNTGTMTTDTGFKFDTHSVNTGLRTRAWNFNNPGSIYCAPSYYEYSYLFLLTYPQCLINASNVAIQGTVDVGVDGLIQVTGNDVDLTHSLLNIEGAAAGATGSGVVGLNTNFWDPMSYLYPPNEPESAFFPIAPYYLYLTNAICYMVTNTMASGTNVIRAVFIQDNSGSNVAASVYFPATAESDYDYAIVEWAGSYLDSASGETRSTYLYLENDYVLGASTNVALVSGVPDSFYFLSSSTPLFPFLTPASQGYSYFPSGTITNLYAFGNFNLVQGEGTNSVDNGSITNLLGRIQLYGDNTLDLSYAQITGLNYLSLFATNQFNGSAGALIRAPYADMYLGVTNGMMVLTNIVQGYLPVWGGGMQAWNTRFVTVTTTQTNDYRILIVGSQVSSTFAAQVQDLVLHGTNSLTISDSMNVMRKFTSDARSLTLTTNPPGNGATSLEGELNLESPGIFWQSSVPNLRYLTNYGAIRMQNLAYFGNPLVTNLMPAVAASGTLSEIGTNAVKKDKVTIGTTQYMFVATLTNTVANQVKMVTNSFDATLTNLIAAINASTGAGVSYSTATKSNQFVTAGPLMGHAFVVTALTNGTPGNAIVTIFTPSTASSNLSWGGAGKLSGGVGITTNVASFLGYTAFINNGVFIDQGSTIYAGNFVNSGIFSNGIGSFTLQSLTATMTNCQFYAGADVSVTADTLVVSNLTMADHRSLTLQVTNLLETGDPSPTNVNFWTVGDASVGYGFSLPIKPVTGDLRSVTVMIVAPTNRTVVNTWAATDLGLANEGYTNNEAIGQLILNVGGAATGSQYGVLAFNGVGVSNALYVDQLVLTNYATHGNATNNYNFPWLKINTNMMIYYAQAYEGGLSVAEAIDRQSRNGANGGRLRWIYSYAGYYSGTTVYYTNQDGTTYSNTLNSALVHSATIDSDGDGIPNSIDKTPFLSPSEIKMTGWVTNVPANSIKIQWVTIPNATNYIYYATNLTATNWLAYTNFKNWYFGGNVARTNSARVNYFVSPQGYIADPTLLDNSQQTNVWVFDTITNVPHYYKVMVWPWLNYPE